MLNKQPSGDMRNVIRTINELPSDYSGHISVLLNDREPMVVARNMILLGILGKFNDVIAADIAVHFWYSAFIPMEYNSFVCFACMKMMEDFQEESSRLSAKLGDNACVMGKLSIQTREVLSAAVTASLLSQTEVADASKELNRIRFEPSRKDRHDRWYTRLLPSHRLAALEFRRFGLVLPFGAANNRFNTPNNFLFGPGPQWLQDDLANIYQYSMEAVIAAGQACGAKSEDLYGCLYFYLSGQLRSFAERLKRFHITFQLFDVDARNLSKDIQSGALAQCGVPKRTRFDHVDVSNIFDTEYVGIPNVLSDWAPLLNKKNPCATILGYSMNWVPKEPGAREPIDQRQIGRLAADLMARGKWHMLTDPTIMTCQTKYMTALYDNSVPWGNYLQKQGAEEAARKAGVKRKEKHTIVSHRIGAPLGASSSTLPLHPNEDSWYWGVQVSTSLLTERYLEFSRI
ncbi:hypothetical protein HWV62_1158 [Athelia sp. TMB]|nr:hypothetical protein HWV62_1158 [Athelia sp. TMB]